MEIRFENLNFGYTRKKQVLKNINLTLPSGKFIAVIGPNGSGKTTMIRILSTLMLPTSGCILADGEVLTRKRTDLKEKITVMTQEYTLRNDMTIAEVLEYQGRLYHVPRAERRERGDDLMEMTGLYNHKDKLVRHLYGGMKRKVMLCRALLPQPELILLDEPHGGSGPYFPPPDVGSSERTEQSGHWLSADHPLSGGGPGAVPTGFLPAGGYRDPHRRYGANCGRTGQILRGAGWKDGAVR